MLGPVLLTPEHAMRRLVAPALRERPCWSIVEGGAVRVRALVGAAEQERRARALLDCRVLLARRRHERLYDPLVGVRVAPDHARAVLVEAVALDEAPLAGDAWSRWTLEGLHAVLLGLHVAHPQLRALAIPDGLRERLPTWESLTR
ncbi:MAG: hypothetical protein H6713_08515 [Myxococcales bacterium]|nr:hypothetical protein [Myxococcales bacterium]MCB9750030.1 hypothetical protein [Myxococcales bacterium]